MTRQLEPIATAAPRDRLVHLASEGDIPAIEVLHQRCSTEALNGRYLGFPPPRAVETLLRKTATYVIPGDDGILAMGNLALRHDGGARWAEVAVLVRDDHQRHGHGTDLIRVMAGAAKGRGARELATITRPGHALAARVMSRSLGPVSVRTEDGLATVMCSLYGTRSLVAVASDEACTFG